VYISGTWYVILTFLNYCGVVTNGFLIGFTSAWGDQYSMADKLWIVIGFEVGVCSCTFLKLLFLEELLV